MTSLHHIVQIGLIALATYIALGVVFAFFFHVYGATHLDHSIDGAGYFFRVLITPGVIALWPLLARKWRNPEHGIEFTDASEKPVTARGLRRLHGIFIQCLAVLLPVLFAAALSSRPVERTDAADHAALSPEPAPLPVVVTTPVQLFAGLPIDAQLRANETGARQLELQVSRDLEQPALALFWSPAAPSNSLPNSATLLGAVWGPGTRRYTLPAGDHTGHLYLVIMGHDYQVLAAAPLPQRVNRKS